ncbi:hypothetical protein [Dyadobacter crusticola]|uniref:hypothetical protein n=1 Tax=Dyadobacter crusticola TaxID=292407 RepID=UPI0012F8AC30|nr:hypothetical protein [Dyadobacter crusticola]
MSVSISSAQDIEKPLAFYANTTDFLNRKEVNTKAIIKSESDRHVHTKKILNPATSKKNRGLLPWAIRYNDVDYFNLGYSDDLQNWNMFARFDIVGRFSAVFIDKDSPKEFFNKTAHGASLAGLLATESTKWNKGWIDHKGEKKRILLINATVYVPRDSPRVEDGCLGNYLSKGQLRELIETNKIDIQNKEVNELSFEEVVEVIHKLNKI